MTFTYDNPVESRRDAMRFLVNDCDASLALLMDEEYDYLLNMWGEVDNDYLLAAYCAEAIAARFAREITISSDSQTLNASELQDKYLQLAVRLRALAVSAHPGVIFAGGMEAGVGRFYGVIPPAFGTQMHDDPAVGQQDYGDQYDIDPYYGTLWGPGGLV